MSDENRPYLLVTKTEGYVPSERTVDALEALARALTADAAEIEVEGFAKLKPEVGTEFDGITFRRKVVGPEPLSFCLGIFETHNGDPDQKSCAGIYW